MIGQRFANWLFMILIAHVVARRGPDFVVGAGNPGGAYLRRWWVIPRNKLFNVYLHEFLRDDDDRALHDHPWPSLSFMLFGAYIEHTIAPGGIHNRERIATGGLRFRSATHAHRIELEKYTVRGHRDADGGYHTTRYPRHCWTLFMTGPTLRRWGFHCSQRGWVPFERFTKPGATGETGAGCEG